MFSEALNGILTGIITFVLLAVIGAFLFFRFNRRTEGKRVTYFMSDAQIISIIGLLVLAVAWALLVPLINRTRKGARPHVIIPDGRILGNAAQQYFLTTGEKSVTLTYVPSTGAVTGPLTTWVRIIGKGYTFPDTTIERENPAAFTLSHPSFRNGQPVTFSDEGKTTLDPAR